MLRGLAPGVPTPAPRSVSSPFPPRRRGGGAADRPGVTRTPDGAVTSRPNCQPCVALPDENVTVQPSDRTLVPTFPLRLPLRSLRLVCSKTPPNVLLPPAVSAWRGAQRRATRTRRAARDRLLLGPTRPSQSRVRAAPVSFRPNSRLSRRPDGAANARPPRARIRKTGVPAWTSNTPPRLPPHPSPRPPPRPSSSSASTWPRTSWTWPDLTPPPPPPPPPRCGRSPTTTPASRRSSRTPPPPGPP